VASGFFAYPSFPTHLGETIGAAIDDARQYHAIETLRNWKELDIPGRFISTEILRGIDASDFLVADITSINFNVTYEIGYAIGLGKRILIVRNEAFAKSEDEKIKRLGIFDSLGYQSYENSKELAVHIRSLRDLAPHSLNIAQNRASPIYVTKPRYQTDYAIRLLARLKKTGFDFRSFDPTEQPRLSASEAIQQVSASYGVLIYLVPAAMDDAWTHNIRAAFLAGLAQGMGRITKIIQEGEDPVPLDYRDFALPIKHPTAIDTAVADFAGEVTERMQGSDQNDDITEQSVLEQVSFGASSAENEIKELAGYYLPTDDFRRALRGEVRLIVGRKGSGKSAVFFRVRDKVSSSRTTVVLALKPDGYQLVKLKERVLVALDQGSSEHTVTAFWQCVLLLEIARAALVKDKPSFKHDSTLYESYRDLESKFKAYGYEVDQGDFAERISALVYRIEARFLEGSLSEEARVLTSPEVTRIIYDEDISPLQEALVEFLKLKDYVWVLFDNIDKGWTPTGIDALDVMILRALIEASRKIERSFLERNIEVHTLTFLRNDVYELLLDSTADRGKEQKVLVDWRDIDALKELIKLRLRSSLEDKSASFEDLWMRICVRHVDGEDSARYLIDRCLMRPRYLLDLLNQVRGVALTLGHEKITAEDIKKGVEFFSSDVVQDTDLELRDMFPEQAGVLYAFIGSDYKLSDDDARLALLMAGIPEGNIEGIMRLLLWFGFFGVDDENYDPRFIYNFQYNVKTFGAYVRKRVSDGALLSINPAFWSALDIKKTSM